MNSQPPPPPPRLINRKQFKSEKTLSLGWLRNMWTIPNKRFIYKVLTCKNQITI